MSESVITPAAEEQQAAALAEQGGGTPAPPPESEQKPEKKKKQRKKLSKKQKRIITLVVVLAVAAAIVTALSKFLSGGEGEAEIMTQPVGYGSITSTVEGSGTAKAKESKAINITTAGTVLDVFVNEGDQVQAGTKLFTIDSPNARTAVDKARQDVEARQKEVDQLIEAGDNLTVRAEFAGKLIEVKDIPEVGEEIGSGTPLATLVDDRTLKLEQYYSYAYESDIYPGQSVTVSIPAVMEQLPGRVAEVNKVSRISPEGSRLFQVMIELTNPGTLGADMAASAVIEANGQTIYPYEQGTLKYNRSIDVATKVSGKVEWEHILNYMDVSAGQELMRITGDKNDVELYNAREALKTAEEDLKKAEENLANLNAVAPISGTVIGLAITPGMEIQANTAVISIADTTTIQVTAQVDERNISYIKAGMFVDINQWGNTYSGFVETVSLNPEYVNGAAMYPATILVDNTEGQMYTGGSVTYSLVASESENCLVLPIQCVKYVPDPETGENLSVVFVETAERPENAVDVDISSLNVPEEGFFAVPVETGISDKYNVEILSGVNEGDIVFMQKLQNNSWG
ncbi:MAG: HlyD family efflux transporter periplasmic adaptor subunit [Oscillospiraceae bacterium]|jgi:HlyD family secretion protein|nr:HlyD family efflux transporter periplasmic adaptor subunit [Oscillospiraceae bacterium]MCI9587067.1 HlyD family efflux transporter periplasmic adaptor subunit [Oscillospiraceae bacterium]